MISQKIRKRINRIIAGAVSAAMVLSMTPEMYMPIYADMVSREIAQADIQTNASAEPYAASVSPTAVSSSLSDYNYKMYEFEGNSYAYIYNEVLWSDAKAMCEALGGHLAYINSEAEQKFITEISKNIYTALGGWDEPSEGNWTWLDGSEMTYTNWGGGEPNNSSPHQNHLYINYNGAGKWDDGYDDRISGFICEWENTQSSKSNIGLLSEYTVFSANQNEDLTLSGWKGYFTGGMYSGRNFVCYLSEFYLDGKADAVGTVTTSGWQINVLERNEYIEAIPMPDLNDAIIEKAGEYTYYPESPSFIQDTTIINGSIMASGEVIISGTSFEGDCYIIADSDITYNVDSLNTTGRIVLYSRHGNITINGTNINIDGIMYAPNGKISFNANETTVNGRIWGDTVSFNGSVFNVKGSDSDLDLIGKVSGGLTKTYTTDEDFFEGTLDGVSLTVPNQLILSETENNKKVPSEKVFGNVQSRNGLKISYYSDKSTISQDGETVNISYGLSGFGEAEASAGIDTVIVIDESGSMSGSRMTNAKAAAKLVVEQMREGDRCALVGYNYNARVIQDLTDDKDAMNAAIDQLRIAYDNNIRNGLKAAIDLFDNESREKYILLISDGEDDSDSAGMALTAGEKGIRIFAMMVGSGSLQMQNIAINSNGIYKNAPSAKEISEIMSYFAAEVFNTAGRNAAFKATVKDKNAIDLAAITPKPSSITENLDGSVTLEWNFDRITIDETENITLSVKAGTESDFAELLTDISCVYYDKNGTPSVIYADDVALPVSRYVANGNWSAVYDSGKSGVQWTGIYWNGMRHGDSNINVYASASEDGEIFSEAVPVENYGTLSGLEGRYIKLNVDMTASSDGKTPELFDITVTAESMPSYDNAQPTASIYSKGTAKAKVPLTIRGIVSDDCLSDKLSVSWSSSDQAVVFADDNALITSAVFPSEGEYEVKLTVSDGINTVTASALINVKPADSYADIDPDTNEGTAPSIYVALPQYAEKRQVINAKIENLNNTEISWYSVIFGGNTVINVEDDGSFALTMPNSNGTYSVTVRAFDWSGKSDMKEYSIIVNSEVPTIEIIPSIEQINKGGNAYFTVHTTLADKIQSIEYILNGETVSIDTDGRYVLDTSETGIYTLTANATTTAGAKLTASASITVVGTSKPIVDLVFDKDSYCVGTDVNVTVVAYDENGIAGVALEYDDEQMPLDKNNSYCIKSITVGKHTLVGIAWNEAGEVVSVGYEIEILPAEEYDTIPPELTVECEKYAIFTGETLPIYINASDNSGTVYVTVEVNGEEVPYDGSGVFMFSADRRGIYEIMVYAKDPIGNTRWAGVNIGVNIRDEDQDLSAPMIELTLDKNVYYEGDDIVASVTASDNVGVTNIIVTVNGEKLYPDENGNYVIENAAIGTYEIKATAYDAAGNSAWTSVTVIVNEQGSDPAETLTLDVYIDTETIEIGKSSDIIITANGGVGEKTITVTVNGEEAAVTDSKAAFTPDKAGQYVIVVTATDEVGNSITKTLTLNVTENGTEGGEKIVTVKLIINDDRDDDVENNEAVVGEEVSVFVEIINLPDSEIESLVVTVNGKEIELDSDKKAIFIPDKVGEYLFNAILRAKDGNVVDLKYLLYVVENGNSGGGDDNDDEEKGDLIVEITSPADIEEVTAPTDIIGTVKGSGLVRYTLEYAPVGTDDFTLIGEGTDEVDGGVLGKLDPTLLRNGYYDVKLTGYTSKVNVSDTVTVYVTGQMKIGNFSIAFQDMDVNVPGLTLTVVRGYDSRDRGVSGDFGYGWNLSMTSADISESSKPSANWSQTQSDGMVSTFRFSEDKAHQVSIDWGNGKTEKFNMKLSPSSSLTPITSGITVSYQAQKGTKSTLEAINKNNVPLIYNSGILMYSDAEPYAPVGYKLTKQDGTIYYFDSEGNVNKIVDTNGIEIKLTYDGIIHSDGKSINYNRDSIGRITSIVSPTGKTVKYTYDSHGDLVAVEDILGYTTKFEYDDHYLTNIIDPRGVSVSRNIYDDNGRLIKTIDSDGNEIVYDHDIDGRQEVITDRNGNITLYIYDDEGNILSQTDANGNTVKNTYDGNGNLDKSIDALGNVTDYGYDETGNLLTLTDAEGHTVTNSYNAKGQLTSIKAMGINTITVAYDNKGNTTSTTDALGNDINYSYDGKGQLTSVTDEIGSYMNMVYDSEGNVVSATNGAGTTSQFTYDADGNCISKTLTYTTEEGVKTVTEQYFYDDAGNLIRIIDSEGNVTTTEYNTMGKVSAATDEKGRKTSYDYDDFGNLVKITYPDSTTESFTYDREGNNLTATDRMGRTVTMSYDKVGNLVSKTYPNGAKVTYTYDANYNIISETSASGGITTYEYDNIGRNTAIIDALENRTSFYYNAKSQLESMTDPMGRTYTYTYDDNGNQVKTTYPDGTSVSTAYDARGRVTAQSDQHGYVTRYTYDGADRLIKVTNAQGISTNYTYDEVGNMTSVTDGNGNVTRYAYDEFGRVVKTTNALGYSAYTTYDESGNVLTTTDYAGNITSYTYDNLDRVIGKTTNDGTVSYAYTLDGKISSVTDNSGTTMFTYDLMDGLSRVDYPDGTYVAYSYDNACRMTSVTTPFGTTSYEYDLLDRIVRVVDRNGYATIYEYDANGNRTAVHYANGLTTTYDYDLLNRLIRQETIDTDGNVVVEYIYTLGVAGERLSVTELDRTVEYTYDSLYRLTAETITEGENTTVYTYAYDNVSNRILKTENGKETAYTYNELNQLVAENDIVYEYDLNGNTVRMTSETKSALYVYNSENRLIRATVQSGNNVSVEEYKYDYAGHRIAKSSEGDYTKYLLDVNGELTYVLAEMSYDGSEKCWYTRGDDLISQVRDGKQSYYVYDGHGSVRALADENGKVTDTYVYDAFGGLISSKGRTDNDFLFAGEQFDAVTGLYYLRARYMNPSVGTFISMDTYQGSIDDPVSLHKYLYANANPVMYSDPSGNIVMLVGTLIANTISSKLESEHDKKVLEVGLKIINALVGIYDMGKTVYDILNSGETGMDLAVSLACGIMSSFILNFSCFILLWGSIGTAIFAVGAFTLGFGIGYAINKGDAEAVLIRAFQLVCILFAAFSPSCFTGDTEVYTDRGLVCIEDIEVGDKVWAYNSETDETELKEVLNVWVKETDEILHINTCNGETIDTTTDHPFYAGDKGWVAAGDLDVGDMLYTAGGDTVEITDIENEKLAEPILVYNLEVKDFHTYFVGVHSILVHNDYRRKPKSQTAKGEAFGSYTIEYDNGMRYHGKGPISRMLQSLQRNIDKEFKKSGEVIDYVFAEWTAADNDIEAFIDEYWRLLNDGGPNGPNYNISESPGRRYFEEWLKDQLK